MPIEYSSKLATCCIQVPIFLAATELSELSPRQQGVFAGLISMQFQVESQFC